MILWWAPGEGLGHLTRVRAAMHTLGLHGPAAVVTTSPQAGRVRFPDGVAVLEAPALLLRRGSLAQQRWALAGWLAEQIQALRPACLWADALPAGIRGELAEGEVGIALGSTPCFHLARRLAWARYRPLIGAAPLRFQRVHLVEALDPAHRAWLEAHGDALSPLDLIDPPADPPVDGAAILGPLRRPGRPLWLVVHAGPLAELDQLVAYARDQAEMVGARPQLVVVSPAPPTGPGDALHLSLYPASPLFPHADRLFTAAGFNAVRQGAILGEAHHILPFPRRWDDPFARAAAVRAARSGGAGVSAGGDPRG